LTFASLGLRKPILDGVRAAGYQEPTEIQAKSIPLILDGHDIIAAGETGSGKTAAFGLPMLNMLLDHGPGLRALILVPTRELCVQVAENLRIYASGTDIHVRTAFGGIDLKIQESAFKRGLDIMVACPGRLIDHLERGNVTLDNIDVLVLDEADRMLDMGFMPQIRRILVRCKTERLNLLFSATMPAEVTHLCKDFLPDAKKVQVGRRSHAPRAITHDFREMPARDKIAFLEDVLRKEKGRVLVFVKTKIAAQRIGRTLKADGLPADSIHGDKSAEARHSVLTQFDRGKIRCMVATDVAARGIDVDDIELVVNFDMPQSVEDYVHRVGRTGRIGKVGHALSLVAPSERGIHKAVLKQLNAKTDAEADEASREAEALNPRRNGRGGPRGGGAGGGRGGGGRGGRGKAPKPPNSGRKGHGGQNLPPRRTRRRA
jgi:ATP-dependent RNA helicase RhlE